MRTEREAWEMYVRYHLIPVAEHCRRTMPDMVDRCVEKTASPFFYWCSVTPACRAFYRRMVG